MTRKEIIAEEIYKYAISKTLGAKATPWEDVTFSIKLHFECEAEKFIHVAKQVKRRIENGKT